MYTSEKSKLFPFHFFKHFDYEYTTIISIYFNEYRYNPNFDSENIQFQVYSFLQIIFMLHEYSINTINLNWIIVHSNKRCVPTTMIYDKDNTIINCLKINIRVFHIQILILKMSITGAFFHCKLFILHEYCTNFL